MKDDKLLYHAIFEEYKNLQFSANRGESSCFLCVSSGVMVFGQLHEFHSL